MKKLSTLLLLILLAINAGNSKSYFVAVTGNSGNTGTLTSPYDFNTAVSKTVAGDTVFIRGGMYSNSSSVTISKSGSALSYIHLVAYSAEIPVFDFRNQVYGSNSIGIKLSGNYVHIKGITVQGAGDNGMQVTGSYNYVENCTFRWNCDSGLQMKTGSNNLIVNCDSYENFDYESGGTSSPDYGGNADGFADKQYSNTGTNTYKKCRSWRNSDDGWDSYEKIGNTVYDSCWCYAMSPSTFDMTDHIRFKTDSASWFYQFKNGSGRYVVKNYGNGNGFKLGGNYTANNATLHNCVAVGNPTKGFDQNNNNGTMTLYNCTSYNNKTNYGFSNSSYGTLIIKNCASLTSAGSNSFSTKTVTQAFNSWNSGFSCSASDFVSLDYTQLLNPRQSDGSLPEINFLHLTPSAAMIDKGTNLGLPYSGTAPDLGAFEYYTPTATPEIPEKNTDFKISYSVSNKSILIEGKPGLVEVYSLTGISLYSIHADSESVSVSTDRITKGIVLVRIVSRDGGVLVKKVLVN